MSRFIEDSAHADRRFKNLTGKEYNNIIVIEDKGEPKVTLQCKLCGTTWERAKSSLNSRNIMCKNKECINGLLGRRVKNRVGQTFNNFTIIQELGKNEVLARCNYCDSIDTYRKITLINGNVKCKNKTCTNALRICINTVGEIHNGLKVIREIGKGKVIIKCMLCGEEREYRKSYLKHAKCLNTDCKNSRSKRSRLFTN